MAYRVRNRPVSRQAEAKRLACEELYRLGLDDVEIANSLDMKLTPIRRILDAYRRRVAFIPRPATPKEAHAAQLAHFVCIWPEIRLSTLDQQATRLVQIALTACLQIEYHTDMLQAIILAGYIEAGHIDLGHESSGGEALELLTLYLRKIQHGTVPAPKSPDEFRDNLIRQYLWSEHSTQRKLQRR